MKFHLRHITNRHYGFFNPADPWSRDHYHKLTLDKATFEELGEPEYLEMTIERREHAPTDTDVDQILDDSQVS